ncbi:hypothetical protein ACHAPJ_012975 [Fusarium lateritium]
MSYFLGKLPPELLAPIISELTLNDVKHISLTTPAMRKIMVPYIYTNLIIDCPLLENSNISNVVQKYGRFIKNLHLRVHIYPNDTNPHEDRQSRDQGGDNVDERPMAEDENENMVRESQQEADRSDQDVQDHTRLPHRDFNYETFWENPPASVWARQATDVPLVKDIIQSKGLPHCHSLSITMDPNRNHKLYNERVWDRYSDVRGHFCHTVEAQDETIEFKERLYAWRAAMKEMWRDIATLSKAERLTICDLMPKRTTAWQEPEWESFLGRLKDLTLFTYGKYHESEWAPTAYNGFSGFFKQLSTYMWPHLHNLERLKIVAHEKGFIGNNSLQFPVGSMPALKKISLENVAAPGILTNFLRGRCANLKEIHLEDCLAVYEEYEDTTTWADLWEAARNTGTTPLGITWKELYVASLEGDDDPDEEERERWARLYKMLEEDKRLKIWPYVELEGNPVYLPDTIVEYLEQGDDNREYIELLEEMERRRNRND